MKLKILVIRFSSLGDVILTTALYPNLRKAYPEAEISVLTKKATVDVFNANPDVDHVFYYDPEREAFSTLAKQMREIDFDVVIDLHGNQKSWIVRLLAGAPRTVVVEKNSLQRRLLVWFKWQSKKLEVSVRENILRCLETLEIPVVSTDTRLYAVRVPETLDTFGIPRNVKLLGLAPGAKHATKRWDAQRFAEAANRLGAIPNTMIILLGSKDDKEVAAEILPHLRVPYKNLAGFTNLKELTAVISSLTFLLTNDSGLMHMAEALKIPLVALFGPTVRQFGFAPYRPTSRVVEVVNLGCRPCTLHGGPVCPLGHHNCMKDIDENAVLFAASSVLGNIGLLTGDVPSATV